jgi:hypothetical protein
MKETQNYLTLEASSTSIAIISFIGGTLLLLLYFYCKENVYLYLAGALYLIIATLINLVVLLHLCFHVLTDGKNRQCYLIKIGIVLSNIPIAFMYSQIVITQIPFS